MLTVGVDLAAEARKTCAAALQWQAGRARVVDLVERADDDAIVALARGADRVGLDCPFGWPLPFVDFVAAHRDGDVPPQSGPPLEWRRRLAFRETDLAVTRSVGLRPLSPSADLIGHVTMRAAALLPRLGVGATDRDGTGRAVEAYPAAALKQWGLPHRGYKGNANATALQVSVSALQQAAPWLDLGTHETLCRTSDDAFDAVVAALIARAAACGLTTRPGDPQRAAARVEGWIAVPVPGSLPLLAG